MKADTSFRRDAIPVKMTKIQDLPSVQVTEKALIGYTCMVADGGSFSVKVRRPAMNTSSKNRKT